MLDLDLARKLTARQASDLIDFLDAILHALWEVHADAICELEHRRTSMPEMPDDDQEIPF